MKASFDDIDGAPAAEYQRWRWSSHKKFMMQAIGANEGLCGIYRFPMYLGRHGSGAFLIPYIVIKIFFVIPLTYMQLALGQYSEKGPFNVWVLCPLAQGLGYTMLILGGYVLLVYNTTTTFSLYFFFLSFKSPVPWSHCDHDWAKQNCMVRDKNATTIADCMKNTVNYSVCRNMHWETSGQHFWLVQVLGNASGEDFMRDGLGYFKVGLSVCMFLSCFLVFLATVRGLKNMEKIVNFTTIYPFVGLCVLVFGTFLDRGATRGIAFLLNGKFSALSDYTTWVRAYEVCILSMGLSFGMLITMGSYCTFRSPTNMDAITLNMIDIFTSIACCILCFNCVGIIAYHYSIKPTALLKSGYNLPFVLVPEALGFINGSTNFWNLLYFSTMFCFGITTQYVIMTSQLSVIYDRFPRTMQYSVFVSGGACILLFLIGLPFYTENGTAMGKVMDVLISGSLQATVLSIQLFVVLWIYAMGRFSDDVHFMLGFRPSTFYQGCWLFAPLVSVMFLFYVFKETFHRLSVETRDVALISWSLVYHIPVGILAVVGIINMCVYFKKNKLRQVLKAVPEWGPVDPVLMKSRRMFSAQAMSKEYMYRQSRLGAHARNVSQNSPGDNETE